MRGRQGGALLLLGLLAFGMGVWALHGFLVDDAYIGFRYVRQAVQGQGWVYNVSERVEGYSNFLWLVLLLPAAAAGMDLVLAAKALGIAVGAGALVAGWALARHLLREEGLPEAWAGWAVVLLGCNPAFAAWAVGGLEAPLFALLVTLGAWRLAGEQQEGRALPWSAFLLALAAMTRPEGALFFLLALGEQAWCWVQRRQVPSRRSWAWTAAFACTFGPYLAWRWTTYGYPFPNTVYVKSWGLHPRAFLEGTYYLYQLVTLHGGLAFALGLPAAVFLASSGGGTARRVALWAGAYLFLTWLGGGDWMPLGRLGVHVLPLMHALVVAGAARLALALGGLRARRWSTAVLAGTAALFLLQTADLRLVQGVGAGPWVPPPTAQARYLRDHVRPGDVVALTDAGHIAYFLPLDTRVVDMVGLTDAHVAHLPVQFPGGLLARGNGFGRWDVDYVLAQEPAWVQVNILEGDPRAGTARTNWTGTDLLLADPRFRAAYVYVVEPGDPEVRGLFRRRAPGEVE
ncbi:MAG: hypothetical protein ACP5UM_00830 [Anaerolineae bacterium]